MKPEVPLAFVLCVGCGSGGGGQSGPIDAMSTPRPDAAAPPDAAPDAAPTGVTFRVTVPANTPAEDAIYLHSAASDYPMTPLGGGVWELRHVGDGWDGWWGDGATVSYVYTRGEAYAGGEWLPGDPVSDVWFKARTASTRSGTVVEDVVVRWRWFPAAGTPLPTMSATLSAVTPRLGGAEFQAGFELVDYGSDSFAPLVPATAQHIRSVGGTWAQLAPPWDYTQVDPLPIIAGFDPTHAQYSDALLRSETLQLRAAGLKVSYRLQVCCMSLGDISKKDTAWWDAWFATYRDFLLYHAHVAAETGVDEIFLSELNLPLPGGAGFPADMRTRWSTMMAAVRAVYHGRIGMQVWAFGEAGQFQLPGDFASVQQIADLFDFYALALQIGVVKSATATQSEIDSGVEALLAATADAIYAASPKPLLIDTTNFASYDGGAIVALGVDEVLNNTYGREDASKLTYDGIEQAMVYQSLMRAIASRPHIVGLFPFNYRYVSEPTAPDWSVRGKAAEGVLSQWYAAFR